MKHFVRCLLACSLLFAVGCGTGAPKDPGPVKVVINHDELKTYVDKTIETGEGGSSLDPIIAGVDGMKETDPSKYAELDPIVKKMVISTSANEIKDLAKQLKAKL
jgi:hypothetical protein